jgi:hypothetical protein
MVIACRGTNINVFTMFLVAVGYIHYFIANIIFIYTIILRPQCPSIYS